MSVNVVFSFQDGAIRHLQDMIGEPAVDDIIPFRRMATTTREDIRD